MLVLTRKVLEELMIGDDVTVTLLSEKNGVIHLGIQAPPTVAVDRKEIREQKKKSSQLLQQTQSIMPVHIDNGDVTGKVL